jgi:hypothetical protein
MEPNEINITEAWLRKAVPRALKKVLKSMESEPGTIIIESDGAGSDISDNTADEIRAWLFRRREDNGSSGN